MVESFKGHIGLPLETSANLYFEQNSISMHIHSDDLESCAFLSVMAFLLFRKHGNAEQTLAFLRQNCEFLGMSASQIGFDTALRIYKEFECLF